jgi:hypothetical protein
MFLYFKKKEFRKFIRECGILKVLDTETYYFSTYDYIRKGLNKWEKEILREELDKIEDEKEKREMEKEMKKEMEENRKKFFEKWKS